LERAKAINNERNIDLESLYGYANKNKARIWDGWIGRYIAEILLSIGDSHINEAEHWIKKAIRVDSENGLKLNMGRDYLFYSKLLRRKGDNSGAVESFNTGLQVLRACGIEGENSPYLK
jgi:DNA modification methylase